VSVLLHTDGLPWLSKGDSRDYRWIFLGRYPSLRSASIGAILDGRSVGAVQAVSVTSSMTDTPSTDAIATAPGRERPEPVSSRNS
jgi:hypothetical protein